MTNYSLVLVFKKNIIGKE